MSIKPFWINMRCARERTGSVFALKYCLIAVALTAGGDAAQAR